MPLREPAQKRRLLDTAHGRNRLLDNVLMAISPEDVAAYLAANIHTRAEVLARPNPVPQESGAYGWWFGEIPADIDTTACEKRDGLILLYAGISPKEPPKNGRGPSKETLRSRINTHYTGNAEGSTLRLTLGCLLADHLQIELRRFGSGIRMHFGHGERDLSRWMASNARVAWLPCPQAWLLETHLLETLDLPLNLHGNARHPFYPNLSRIRGEAMKRARSLPALPNPGIGGASID
jgi:hypothetical protein